MTKNWTRRRLRLTGTTCVLLALTLALPIALAGQSAAPSPVAAPAAKLRVEGLPNLAQVTETLYRGAQPKDAGYAKLQELGIAIVVNLRDEKDKIAAERAKVEALGLRYVSLPWRSREKVTNKQVADFLALVQDNPEKKIFVHCRRGADRTGVMVAAYRIARQGWMVEQALEEMEKFGFHGLWFRHMKKYVRDFPRQLQEDPRLRTLRRSPPDAVRP